MSETLKKKKLPVGVDLFENIVEQDYYYVDKSLLIKKIIEDKGAVNLFTRPRRFGKTLNMSMLKSFFEIGTNPSMFDGLAISQEREICENYQGKYPVIFLSLKGVSGLTFAEAMEKLSFLLAAECIRLSGSLAHSERADADDLDVYKSLKKRKIGTVGMQSSLVILMRMLHAHYGKKVILIIDEYDVPLDKANDNGYYHEMVNFLRGFFGEAFKTNPDLYFAVVTGCLRISKESIFTGINNLKTDTIADERYDEFFGFTDEEVRKMLADYGLSAAYAGMKEWYDGYRFGRTDVYCPWDVICHCDQLRQNPAAKPKAYWNNTSSNQIVRRFVDLADATTRTDIEKLIAGKGISRKVVEDLTYGELEESREHLWSVLYLTGYLTLEKDSSETEDGKVRLVIPNREIREIFIEKIQKWFGDKVQNSTEALLGLCSFFAGGDASGAEKLLNTQLRETISYYDSYEGFYHGFLLGLLKGKADWIILSNRESGNGRSDIQIRCEDGVTGIIIEVKHAKKREEMPALCDAALRQIADRAYAETLFDDGYLTVWAYGISFYRKCCQVRVLRMEDPLLIKL